MSNEIVPFDKQLALANAFAESRLFGIASPAQALSLMALCEAENMHPAIAMRDYHIMDNGPSLKADAMLSRFQASGGRVKWLQYTDECVEAEFVHPVGGELTVSWDMDRAKKAGLGPGTTKNGAPNMWSKYPRQMLRARVISEGIRTIFPGIVSGFYTPEEVMDFEPRKEPATVEYKEPVAIEHKSPSVPEQPEQVDDLITAITELAGMMDVDMAPSECLAKLTNNKYTSMHQVRTMPKAHRDKLAAKVGAEKEALTP